MDEPKQKELEEKLALAEKERDEYLNGWKRAKADLINAKKEWEEGAKGLTSFIKMEFVEEFLPVLDALDAAGESEGFSGIKKLALGILSKNGITEIEALGQKFDPAYHEAVAEGEGEAQKVIEVLQKGYTINSLVIRPAKVKIGKQL
ncbi:MAG: nucleotide exchange factor GrpE [Patescibacteria group bacterium]